MGRSPSLRPCRRIGELAGLGTCSAFAATESCRSEIALRHLNGLHNAAICINLGCFGIFPRLLHCRDGLDREAPISDSPFPAAAPHARRAPSTTLWSTRWGSYRKGRAAWRPVAGRPVDDGTRLDGPRGLAAQLGLGAF